MPSTPGMKPGGFYEDLIFPVSFRGLRELTEPIESDPDLAPVFRVDRVEARLEEDPGRYEFRFISVGVLLTRTPASPG